MTATLAVDADAATWEKAVTERAQPGTKKPMSSRTFWRAVKRLLAEQLILMTGKGYYAITPEGRERIGRAE